MGWPRWFGGRGDVDREIDREIAFHLEERIQALLAEGVSRSDASRRARAELGGVDAVKRQCRDVRRLGWCDDLGQDARYSLRALGRDPVFTLAAVLSLALGIGANTAMFSILDRVLVRELPVASPEELVFLYDPGPSQGRYSSDESGGPSFSYLMFRELQAAQPVLTGLAGAREQSASLAHDNQASAGRVHLVSGNYFTLLGVQPALGRLLTDSDDEIAGGNPVAVLSHAYWTARFDADASVLDETLVVNGYPLTIVGVAERTFISEKIGSTPAAFVPITMKGELTPDWGDGFRDRLNYWIPLMGRLKPGVTRERAETALNVLYRAQIAQDTALLRSPSPQFLREFEAKRLILRAGERGRAGLAADVQQPLYVLAGMTLLVLLIACANVANLQLARATTRTREVAVRLALGASRGQLVRQLLTESLLLALAGGCVGLLVAHWTVRGTQASVPADVSAYMAATSMTATLDARVLLFCFALAVATGLLFGLYPAVHFSRADLAPSLKQQTDRDTSTAVTGVFRRSLVTLQTGVAVLLLVAAGLFGRTLVNLTAVDLGIQADRLMSFRLTPKLIRYTDAQAGQLYDDLIERLGALPGVTLASAAIVPAVGGETEQSSIAVEGFTPTNGERVYSRLNLIGPGYFRTLGIPLVAGREFERADDLAAPRVAIVNEAFVREFMADQNPLGRRLAPGGGASAELDTTIVGVVRDAKYASVREAAPSVFYIPYRQRRRQEKLWVYVRTRGQPEGLVGAVRETGTGVAPGLPLQGLNTVTAQVGTTLATERLLTVLTSSFAGLAALLAAIGLYGVLAYTVARRTREIGIRMALGATAAAVRRLVVREGIVMVVLGISAGLGTALAVSRLMTPLLYGLTPWDPVVYGAVALLAGVVTLVAGYAPARRATRIDPVVALRYE